MAGRGRRPTPAPLKKLQGSRRWKKTAPAPSAPTSPLDASRPPDYVAADPVARAEWDRVVAALGELGVVRDADVTVAGLYCSSYALLRRMLAALARDKRGGAITPQGRANPLFIQYAKLLALVRLYLGELGLTPATRGRLAPPAPAEEDPFAEFDRWTETTQSPDLPKPS